MDYILSCCKGTLVRSVSLGPGHLVVAFFSPFWMGLTKSAAKSKYGTRTSWAKCCEHFEVKLQKVMHPLHLTHKAHMMDLSASAEKLNSLEQPQTDQQCMIQFWFLPTEATPESKCSKQTEMHVECDRPVKSGYCRLSSARGCPWRYCSAAAPLWASATLPNLQSL